MKKHLLFAALCCLTMVSVNAQTTSIYLESFDGSTVTLPTGWATSGTPGWELSTSNSSSGLYAGASGGTSVKIDNQDVATGSYSLSSKSISTTGYASITVSWGARLTTSFPPSSISPMVYYSIDNGANWTGVSYTEQSSGSAWKLNGPISMPTAVNNQASVKFQLVANITAAANGAYRIDDFQVMGAVATNTTVTITPTSIKNNEATQTIESYVYDNTLSFRSTTTNAGVNAVKLFDITGKELLSQTFANEMENNISLSGFTSGIYLVKFEMSNGRSVAKKVLLYN